MPTPLRRLLAWVLALLWFDVLRIRRRVAVANVALAFPEWSKCKQIQVARRSLFHLCLSVLEYSHLPFLNEKWIAKHVVIEGQEYVDRALTQGKGVLFLGLHMGNGDLAMTAYAQLGFHLHLISKEFKSRWLNDLWFGVRRKHGLRFIPHEKSSFEILRAVKRNELVMFVLDQFMGPPIGVKTNFFGHPTGTAAGLALLAGRTGAPVIPAYTFRDAKGLFHIVFLQPIVFQDVGPTEQNIAVMTQTYTDKIEEIVRRHPEQWMWIHRRWKKFG